MRRVLRPDPGPAGAHAHLPETHPQTSDCWRSTGPPWTQRAWNRSNTREAWRHAKFSADPGTDKTANWLTSAPVCQHPPLQRQTAALCSSMAALPRNGESFNLFTSYLKKTILNHFGCKRGSRSRWFGAVRKDILKQWNKKSDHMTEIWWMGYVRARGEVLPAESMTGNAQLCSCGG